MQNFLLIFFSAILVNNFVLSKFLGICPFLGVSKKLNSAFGMSVAVTFVMVMSTAITYPIYNGLLAPFGLEYLNKIAFILVIAMFVQLVEIVIKRFMPPLYTSLGVYLPLITTNCAVLGVTVLNIDEGYTFWESIVNSFGAGVGFLLAMVLFSGIREKLEQSNIPKAFKGMPSTLVAASLLAVSFMGFSGIVENIFG
ncbi:electron transport complex, RnfABCDGE type, A subunit [[Clostridium] methylpentosum DSM 5476]|uniref:Ion-translocating oxidoreductase complex subunit A n=1 Tax=[Clostridium] methylpentosum DSM 5476 TaxID=537013 RepID=C0ECT1_9FIRM|nr:electron transport complex, RnfABCDGE type, A subunit [[Clostridium] methylpentosum DSM 5476]MDY3989731.1 electron transport complex subunit RsxA [Massilioclostridium sp.]MEE1491019.1 electron transport complex subunit RsxA [Massilioclostridium sp.]